MQLLNSLSELQVGQQTNLAKSLLQVHSPDSTISTVSSKVHTVSQKRVPLLFLQ